MEHTRIADEISIFNRMNPSRLYLQFFSFCAYIIAERVKAKMAVTPQLWKECYDYVLEFLRDINPNYADLVDSLHSSPVSQQDLVNEICKDGIYIQLMGFTEGIGPEKVKFLQEKYDIKKGPVTFGVKQKDGTWKMVTTKKPVLIGDEYFFLLYKMPHQRCSGLSYINQYRTPIRPSATTKLQYPFAQTPIKLGEDEMRNLQMIGGPELPARVIGLYANSAPAVNMLAEHLLFAQDPAKLNHINMTTEQIVNTNSIVGVAQHIFSCFGVNISTNTAKLDMNKYGDIALPSKT